MPVRLSNVVMQMRSDMPGLMRDIAAELKRRTGCAIHAYVETAQQREHYEKDNGDRVYDTISDSNRLLRVVDEPLPPADEILREARAMEARIGETYNSLALTNRHFGRGYALAGGGHPRSRQFAESSYLHLLHGYNRQLGYWQEAFESHGVDLVISTGKETAVVARMLGIPYRGLFGARHKHLHFWGDDEYRGSERLVARYRQMVADGIFGGVTMDAPYALAQKNHARVAAGSTLTRMLTKVGIHAARRIYWRLRGYEKGRGYFFRDEVALFYRRWRDWRQLRASGMRRLSELDGMPFVFFPLQTEPETSIQQGSPEYFFQHAAIAALSRDLPAGYRLVVKESPFGIGRRPRGFYEKIAELKNVILLDIDERGLDVVRAADAVATLVGTAGFEAAVMGKPVISFGRHNIYDCLPHVFVVRDEGALKDLLALALGPTFDQQTARVEGQRFLQAVTDTSFDLGEYDYHNKRGHTPEVVAACVDNLLDSLEPTEAVDDRPIRLAEGT